MVTVVVEGLVDSGIRPGAGAALGTSVATGASFGAMNVAIASGSVSMMQNAKMRGLVLQL